MKEPAYKGFIGYLWKSNFLVFILYMYKNNDLKLRNKLYGQMHYKIGVTCVFNGHVVYTL